MYKLQKKTKKTGKKEKINFKKRKYLKVSATPRIRLGQLKKKYVETFVGKRLKLLKSNIVFVFNKEKVEKRIITKIQTHPSDQNMVKLKYICKGSIVQTKEGPVKIVSKANSASIFGVISK